MKMPGATDPLAALRPLHEPPPVSWWPPAPGWWILAALLTGGVIWLLLWYLRTRPRRAALRELHELASDKGITDCEFASSISILLKRYAIFCLPGQDVSDLSGERWLEFLERNAPSGGFVSGPGRVLAHDIYSPECTVDREALAALAREWIRKLPCRKKTVRGRDS